MEFNPSKGKVLHISKSRHPAQHIYMLHGQALEAMDHAKYLGMDISKDLSWNTHINRISIVQFIFHFGPLRSAIIF